MPEQRRVRPVRLQITMVSMNTSKMPYRACFTGSGSEVVAWAMGAVPRPASLEKMPRFIPQLITRNTEPTAPPVTPLGVKAPTKISWNTLGRASALYTMTARQARM